jgi:hypothetical protein
MKKDYILVTGLIALGLFLRILFFSGLQGSDDGTDQLLDNLAQDPWKTFDADFQQLGQNPDV